MTLFGLEAMEGEEEDWGFDIDPQNNKEPSSKRGAARVEEVAASLADSDGDRGAADEQEDSEAAMDGT